MIRMELNVLQYECSQSETLRRAGLHHRRQARSILVALVRGHVYGDHPANVSSLWLAELSNTNKCDTDFVDRSLLFLRKAGHRNGN